MSNPTNIELLTQTAVIDWINNVDVHEIVIDVPVRNFETDKIDAVSLPMIVVRAVREAEEFVGSGIWRVRVEVGLIAQADDTDEATLDAQWGNLSAILAWDQLAARLSDLDGFTCHGVVFDAPSEKQTIERHWSFKVDFTAFVMAMD